MPSSQLGLDLGLCSFLGLPSPGLVKNQAKLSLAILSLMPGQVLILLF